MSGHEVLARAREAYLVGLISVSKFEAVASRAVAAGATEVPAGILLVPLSHEIAEAKAALRKDVRLPKRMFR